MSATIDVRCPKCGEKMGIETGTQMDLVLCVHCGHEFTTREDKPRIPEMRRMGPGRAEMESVGTKKGGGGGGFILLMILIVLIAIVLGFVNFWVAVTVGIIGLLAGILVQLGRIANKS
jgi:DNA-directed RNA polymerase subunit RPC12/RpoP